MTAPREPWLEARDLEAAVQRVAGLLVRVYGAAQSEETRAQARRLTLAALDWPTVRGSSHSQSVPRP